MCMNIFNPATGDLITNLPEDNTDSITQKISWLQSGQKEWGKTTLPFRITVLQKFSELLTANIDALAQILTNEVGKPLQQSKNEINGACHRINWLTNHATTYLSDEWMVKEGETQEKIVYEPLGVIVNISAWNYPYLVGVNVFVPALLAGNAVLYKPSELATLTGLEIEKYLLQAGIPANVFKTAIGAG